MKHCIGYVIECQLNIGQNVCMVCVCMQSSVSQLVTEVELKGQLFFAKRETKVCSSCNVSAVI